MTYEYLKNLKKYNKTIKLLNSDNFAMMVGFFYFVFVKRKHISITHSAILSYLEDYLYELNSTYDNLFSKSAKEYLSDFVSDANGYLRKYHGSEDEPLYELTPHTNKVFEFLEGLEQKEFVGSRSKFNIILELLEELDFETNMSDEDRIKRLQKQKEEIDAKIEAIKKKEDLRFDSSRIKEHFMVIEEQARKLKYDFAQIEYNFRDLNKEAMEQIASNSHKDRVLSSIFDIEDAIRQSDQGKSFFAFWQLLTDSQKSEKFSKMLEALYEIDAIKDFDKEQSLKGLKYDLLVNARKITKVSTKLIEQLRRFIDDRVYIEHKKIVELCNSIEKSAIAIKHNPPKNRDVMRVSEAKVKVDSVFEKSLFVPKKEQKFENEVVESIDEVNIDALYDIFYVDEEEIKSNIDYFLQIEPQCVLSKIVQKFPIKKGISELIVYLSIAKNSNSIIDEQEKEIIDIVGSDGVKRLVKVPKIVFVK